MNPKMTADDFEQRYGGPDQWSSEDDLFEQARYDATLAACGPGPFESALELGGSIGVLTERLAPRCEHLTTIDVARTAAAMARRRVADLPQVEVLRGAIPDGIPERDYDLVLASEVLYHLSDDDFERTLAVIRARLVRGGRLVSVHIRAATPEHRPLAGREVHARLRDDPWLVSVHGEQAPGYVLDVLQRR